MKKKFLLFIIFILITGTFYFNNNYSSSQEVLVKYFFSIPYWRDDDAYQISEAEALERGNYYKVIYYSKGRPAIIEYYQNQAIQYRYNYSEHMIIKSREAYENGVPDGFWFAYKEVKAFPRIRKRILFDMGTAVSTTLYTYYFNGETKSEQNFSGNAGFTGISDEISEEHIKDGYVRKYDREGRLLYEAYYTDGLLDGEERIFEDGKIKEVHHYNKGVRSLQSALFDLDNNTRINIFYEDGEEIRKDIIARDIHGRTVKIQKYLDKSIPYGIWEYYDDDARLIKIERYKNGMRHNEWQYYKYINDVRKMTKIEKYKEDDLKFIKNFYYDDITGRRTKEECYNKEGLPHKEWYYYDDKHNLLKKEIYIDGIPNGTWITWDYSRDGRMESQSYVVYENGEIVDTYEYEYDEFN